MATDYYLVERDPASDRPDFLRSEIWILIDLAKLIAAPSQDSLSLS